MVGGQRGGYGGGGMDNASNGYGRGGARSSYTHFNNDFNNGGLDLGGYGGPMGAGTRGFGTGELKSYGYQGPPSLNKGSSVSSNMMGGGPIRGMDLGYDSMSQGYNNNQNNRGSMKGTGQ